MVGDKRKFLTCLIADRVRQRRQTPRTTTCRSRDSSLCRACEINDDLGGDRADQPNFARVETIKKKFRLIEQQLTAGDDEVTPTMKLKRKFVNEKYKAMIDGMYAEAV